MRKNQVVFAAASAAIFLLIGTVLTVPVLWRLRPVLDGDSILADGIAVLSSLTLWDYIVICLSVGFCLVGLVVLAVAIVAHSRPEQGAT
jgi:hypothetical protein